MNQNGQNSEKYPLIPAKKLIGYELQASDGELGPVKDILLDDRDHGIRYIVVDTAKWLAGRLVLISPQSISRVAREEKKVHVDLTQDQVRQSPPLATDEPIARQREQEYLDYYGWVPYLPVVPPSYGGVQPAAAAAPTSKVQSPQEIQRRRADEQDEHLRSVSEIIGYTVLTDNDKAGHIDDFIVDINDWRLKGLVADVRQWLPGGQIVVTIDKVVAYAEADQVARLSLTEEQLRQRAEMPDPDDAAKLAEALNSAQSAG
jgi:sporulation protein YlmC with PRC-barrel domain